MSQFADETPAVRLEVDEPVAVGKGAAMTADVYRRWLVLALRVIGWAGAGVAGLSAAFAFAALFFGVVVLAPDPANHGPLAFGGVIAAVAAGLVGLISALVAAVPFLALAEVLDLLRKRDA